MPGKGEDKRVRWGVAGCGWVARDFVLPALGAARNCEVVALLDPNPEALRDAGLQFPDAEAYSDGDAFFAAPGVEAVYVATPNHLHRPLVEAAAQAGKHVLCEKPMAATLSDAEAMVAACREAGVFYGTAFDQRFHAAHRRLKTLISSGALGTVCSARVHYACWLPPEWDTDNWRADPGRAGGGAFMDLAPHGLDLIQHLLGEEISEVRCLVQHRVHEYPVEDGAALVGLTTDGVLFSQHVSYNTPETYPHRTLEVSGTEALAVATDTLGQDSGGTLELVYVDGSRERVAIPPEEDHSPFLFQIEAFSEALLEDRDAFPFKPEQDLHTMRLVAAAMENAGEKFAGSVV